MEHRFCYLSPIGRPKTGPSSHPRSTPEADRESMESTMEDQLNDLNTGVIESRINRNPQDIARTIQEAPAMLAKRLQQTSETFRTDPQLQRAREVLMADKEGGAINEQVLAMIEQLQTMIPAPDEEKHPYGSTTGLMFDNMHRDWEFIQTIQTAQMPAEKARALSEVSSAIKYLAEQDPRHLELWKMKKEKDNSPSTKAINEIGKLTLVITSLLAGIVTGVPAAIKLIREGKVDGKGIIAPMLCFGVAGLTGSSEIQRMVFGDIPKNVQEDLRAVLANPKFRELSKTYNIEGKNWSRVIQTMIEEPDDTKEFVAKLTAHYNGKVTDEEIAQDIDAYVKSFSLNETEAASLRSMIEDDKFLALHQIIGFARTDDARAVVFDYVRMGARQSEQKAYAVMEQMKEQQQNAG